MIKNLGTTDLNSLAERLANTAFNFGIKKTEKPFDELETKYLSFRILYYLNKLCEKHEINL